jgi:hypothetical protein
LLRSSQKSPFYSADSLLPCTTTTTTTTTLSQPVGLPSTSFPVGCQIKLLYILFISPFHVILLESRDSSVGIALGYRLDDRGSRVRFPAGIGNFSLHHRVQNGSEAHPASYPMVPGTLSLGLKRLWPEADHSPPSSAEVKE